MYKILLADDERIIREGISKLIDWKKLDLELVDMACNGEEAYQKALKYKPDIIITDIKMPGMSGLELIEKITAENADVKFIILSGYGEFSLAKKAMKFGIKHYLLKPTDEKEITNVINEVLEELECDRKRKEFLFSVKREMESMIPLAKEQFIRDRALNKIYSNEENDFYKEMLGIENSGLRVLLFELDDDLIIEEMFALERIAASCLSENEFYYKTSIKNSLMVLVKSDYEASKLFSDLNRIKNTFRSYYKKDITVSISSNDTFDKLHVLYQEAKQLLKYKFYAGEGSIICKEDVKDDEAFRVFNNYYFLIEQIVTNVKCGDTESVSECIKEFMDEIKNEKLEQDIIISHSMELLLSVIRNNFDNIKDNLNKNINEYFERIINMRNMKTIDALENYIKEIAVEISEANHKTFDHRRNRLVEMMLSKIEENIGNENLSLKWLSENQVFASVDYLGKLFKKEMNMGFSQYVMKQRMEKAKKMIRIMPDDMIYEIAYKVGFGNNSQYFSQVFKSYSGLSPSDYKKSNASEM
jgi:two-component system response regulator YesN